LRLNRLLLLAAIPVLLVLLVTAYLSVQFSWNERAAQGWVRHTYEVMGQLQRISDDLDQASSGQRGYIITGEQQFLTPYRQNVARIGSDLDHFAAITRDNPFEQHNAQVMRGLVARRLATMEQGLALASQTRRGAPQLLATIDAGKPAMDQLRRRISEGLGEEGHLLQRREAERRTEEFYEAAYAGSAALLALIILLAAAAMLIRNNASLAAGEHRRAHEAAMLRATLDAIRDGVAFFDSTGLLCAFNDNFFRLLEFPRHLAAVQTPIAGFQAIEAGRAHQFLSPPDAVESENDFDRLVLGDRELEVYRRASASGGFVVVVADITARVRAETMLRQTQKMESIGHLTGGVAHDFNNLLQIVSANLDLALAGPEAAASGALSERLKNALAAVVRGSRLTGQLLAFARRQPLNPRSTDLGRLMQDMTEMLRRTLGEQIQVESIVAGGLWNTLVDSNQVENVVLNLAINARDAMPDGGKLTVEVANAYLDDNYAGQHDEVSAGQYVMLAVSDTGAGMTQDVMARVFEPFFTTKPEGKGTGLGLAQAYGFAKQSGGHIKVYSEPGEGTTVKLYLPRTRKPSEAVETTKQAPPRGGSEKILVVEDDDGVRAAVVDMLTDLGYQVNQADNAERALALLESGTAPALLFTDVVMPGATTTRDFTQRAQNLCPGLRVLYTSGYTQNAIVHNGKLDEGVSLLSKPYRKDELARKIRSLLDGAPGRKKGRVLVVEDDALIRMSTIDMVTEAGFETLETGDGARALALLQQNEDVEILLTDLGLPGMNGRDLVTAALRLRPGLKVIVASGYSSNAEAPKENVTQLRKPFDMFQLRRALED
jgi:signal transduction histidine kinase/DNA-binding response OmpR family regulator